MVYLLLLLYCGHSFGALMYLKTKTLSNVHPSTFLLLLQKVQLSGWYFESCRPIPSAIRNIEVTTFACFYNFDLAQDFSCSVKKVECGQIFILACQQLRKKGQHNCIGELYFFCYLPTLSNIQFELWILCSSKPPTTCGPLWYARITLIISKYCGMSNKGKNLV